MIDDASKLMVIRLDDIYRAFRSYMYLEETDIIDLILAVALSREQTDEKLWLIIIGPSSDGKSELVKVLDDNEITTKVIKNMTAQTLVNGFKGKGEHPDLAPKLRDKIMLIPEMASILKLHPNEKAQVWAQLRDLYDGEAGKQSGEGADTRYTNLNVTFIGCSTPAIDSQILIHQDLGTRELLYRTRPKNQRKLMDKVIENNNLGNKKEKAKKCAGLVQEFLQQRKFQNKEISPSCLERIKRLAEALTKLRATAETDLITGELNNLIYPEEPARVLGQLMILFKALKSLDENYSDEQAIKIVLKVVLSCSSEIRIQILKYLMLHRDDYLGQKKVADSLKIGNKTAYKELNILTHLELLNKQETTPNEEEPYKTVKRWQINTADESVKTLAKEMEILLEVIEEVVDDAPFNEFTKRQEEVVAGFTK
jgi:hypothetical protein